MFERPNDERGFIHKRLFGAAKAFIGSGFNPLAAARGFATAGRGRKPGGQQRPAVQPFAAVSPARPVAPRTLTARPSEFSAAEKQLGTAVKFGASTMPVSRAAPDDGGCIFPLRRDPRTGKCKVFLGEQSGRDDRLPADRPARERKTMAVLDQPIGDAVMGRYGAGEVPGNMVVDRAVCRSGMHLGNDGICYNKGVLNNKQRQWPKGHKPLLTGGEMKAITIAATAGRRLSTATKRLQSIGLMKKPVRRTALPRHQHAKQIAAVSV